MAKATKTLIEIFPAEIDGNYPKFDDIFPKDKGEYVGNLFFDRSTMFSLSKMAYKIAQKQTLVDISHAKPIVDIQADFEYYITEPARPGQYFSRTRTPK